MLRKIAKRRRGSLLLFFFLLSAFVFPHPADTLCGVLRAPFDFPLYLSGNFAELRSNHFHGGIDFKTQGVEGKPIHCPADGYISRISVSPGGYGNALYITHDCGYTTVHGHLKSFTAEVARVVREHQYRYETFALDTTFAPERFPVRRGEVVGLAGNSGYSFGPHLHMEVRETETGDLIDPLLFYRNRIKDTTPPRFHKVRLTAVEGKGIVSPTPSLSAWGLIFASFSANDYMDGTHNTYGVRSVTLTVDGQEVWHLVTDRFSFAENRAINTLTDYADYRRTGNWWVRSYVAPGNPLRMVRAVNGGVVDICEERPYRFEYTFTDLYGNTSRHAFTVQGIPMPLPSVRTPYTDTLRYDRDNLLTRPRMRLTLPQGALYEDCPIVVGVGEGEYRIGIDPVPLHVAGELSICVEGKNDFVEDIYQDKLYLRATSEGRSYAILGRCEAGWFKAPVRELGCTFSLAIDTVPPRITPVGTPAQWRKQGVAKFKVGDSETGLSAWRATIGDRWTLAEYSSKSRLITIPLSASVPFSASAPLRLRLTDGVGNVKEEKYY